MTSLQGLHTRFGAFCVAAILLAGCATAGADGPTGSNSAHSAANESLVEVLGLSRMSDADAATVIQREIEAETAQCMRRNGFEYTERTVTGQIGSDIAAISAQASSLDHADTAGYGAFSNASQIKALESGQLSPPADPNQAALSAMSEQERVAWDLALYGSPGDIEALADSTGDSTGCANLAAAVAVHSLQILTTMGDALADLENRFNVDSRVIESNRRWAACMAEAGMYYESGQAARDDVWDQVIEAFATADQDPSELDSLRRWEIKVATTDATCAEAEAENLRIVRSELEAEFLSRHGAALQP